MTAAEIIKLVHEASIAEEQAREKLPRWTWNITRDNYPLYISSGLWKRKEKPEPFFAVSVGGGIAGREDLLAHKMNKLTTAQWETILDYRRTFDRWCQGEIDTDDMPKSTDDSAPESVAS